MPAARRCSPRFLTCLLCNHGAACAGASGALAASAGEWFSTAVTQSVSGTAHPDGNQSRHRGEHPARDRRAARTDADMRRNFFLQAVGGGSAGVAEGFLDARNTATPITSTAASTTAPIEYVESGSP